MQASANQPGLRVSKHSRPFPSPPLVILSVVSCFVASAALISSFTQVTSHFGYFVVPSIIGFIAAIPYHVHMYTSAIAHRPSPTHPDQIFISNDWIIYNFLLITLWAVIFIINILFCVGEGTAGVIIATIWSGLEWIVLLVLVLLTIAEIRRSETSGDVDSRVPVTDEESRPLLASEAGQHLPETSSKIKPIYFISYTLCSLTLVLGIDVHVVVLFNVIAFFLTAPHHIALFISSARSNSPFKFLPSLSHPTSVAYAFLLSAVWCGTVILDILVSRFAWQSILLGIFGGVECIIIIVLAVRSVLDRFSEGQIKL